MKLLASEVGFWRNFYTRAQVVVPGIVVQESQRRRRRDPIVPTLEWQGLGTVRRSLGTVRRSLGTVRRSLGTVRRNLGTVRRSLGTVRRSLGTVRRSPGTVRESLGTVPKCLGTGGKSLGTVLRGLVLGRAKCPDIRAKRVLGQCEVAQHLSDMSWDSVKYPNTQVKSTRDRSERLNQEKLALMRSRVERF